MKRQGKSFDLVEFQDASLPLSELGSRRIRGESTRERWQSKVIEKKWEERN
jgi:hypothetical protein